MVAMNQVVGKNNEYFLSISQANIANIREWAFWGAINICEKLWKFGFDYRINVFKMSMKNLPSIKYVQCYIKYLLKSHAWQVPNYSSYIINMVKVFTYIYFSDM